MPSALTGRLDALTGAADQAGLPTSRKELLAAILHAAPPAPRKLSAAIKRYRGARVEDAFVPGQRPDTVLNPLRKPGPRQRRLWEERPSLFTEDELEAQGPAPLNPTDELLFVAPRRIGIDLPIPLSRRLDDLVDLAERARERTNRQELIASLILTTPATPKDLLRLLTSYRTATIRDTIIPGHDPAPYLEQGAPRRGRPAREQRGGGPGDSLPI